MTKTKKLKNKKRYLGNPFTVAFLPVLAAAGLTLGATGMSLKGAASEESKQHDIVLPQPSPETTKGWKVSAYNNEQQVTRARKGELITFVVQEQAYGNEEGDEPTAIKINNIPYKLLDGGSFKYVDVEIPFIETMTISLDFTKEPEFLWTVTFRTHPTDPEICYKIKAITGAYVDRPTDPVVENYEFVGWYKDASFNEEWDFAHDKITQHTTIYSKWNALSPLLPHTVTKIDMPDQPGKRDTWELTAPETAKLTDVMDIHVDVKSGKTPTVYFPQAVTINGRLFPLQKVSDTQYKPVIEIVCPFMVDMTIEVLFDHILPDSHLVSFDSQGGTSVATQNVKTGETAKEPTGEDIPTKEHYQFTGWYTNKECTTSFDFSTPITEDITLYAGWSVIKNWQITFIKDPEKPEETEVQTIPNGTMPTHADPTKTKEGYVYTFKHWLGREDKEPYTERIGIQKATTNITYTAVFDEYQITNPVIFETGCELTEKTQIVKYGEKAEKPTDLSRTGYEEVVWYTTEARTEGTEYDFDTAVKAPLTLYAKWTPKKYTVTFKWTNYDGQEITDPQEFDFDSMPSHDAPVIKEPGYDHVFLNWINVTDPDPSKHTKGLTKVPANNDTVYEAEFKRIPRGFVMAFNSNGGTEVTPMTIMPGELASAPSPAPTKGSYTLEGWYKDEALTDKWDFDNDRVNADTTLHAKWNETEEDPENLTCGNYNDTTMTCTLTGYKGKGISVKLPSTYTYNSKTYTINKIGDSVFMGMASLKEVILPESIKEIGSYCFQTCINLEKINTQYLTKIGNQAFTYTEKLTTFTLPEVCKDFTAQGGRQFMTSKLKKFLIEPTTSATTGNNLNFTNDIAGEQHTPWTFLNCQDLEEVWLPNRIVDAGLGRNMFYTTPKLTVIRFEGSWARWQQLVSNRTSWAGGSSIKQIWCYNGDITSEPEVHTL